MSGDFRKSRRLIVRTQTQSPMQPKDRRKGAGYEPEIVELRMKNTAMDVRLHQPAIDDIRNASQKEERVAQIAKARHVKEG